MKNTKTCRNNRNSKHVSFWCKECEVATCEDCLEFTHDRHSISGFKRYLQKEMRRKLGDDAEKKLENYLSNGKKSN